MQGLSGVVVYINDILITGKTPEEHLHNLDQVMNWLEQAGVTLKESKCTFAAPSVEYLGHIIDKDGLYPSKEKLQAIHLALEPRNITEFKSFIGLLIYYSKFLPKLSVILFPLYRLLQKHAKWKWTEKQSLAFNQAKKLLQSSTLASRCCSSTPYGGWVRETHCFHFTYFDTRREKLLSTREGRSSCGICC